MRSTMPAQAAVPTPPASAGAGGSAAAASTGIQMHLEALKQHFGAGANNVIRAIDQLEQNQDSSPRLTHGHLSKMGRAQKQVDACRKALQDEDNGWRTFVAKAKKSLQDRFVAYQDARVKKQAELKEAQDNLTFVRQEVKQVVESLRTDVKTEESGIPVPTPEEALLMMGHTEIYNLEDGDLDADDIEIPDGMEEDQEIVDKSALKELPDVKAFSRRRNSAGSAAKPGSPKQVRQAQLKAKSEEKKNKEEPKEAGGGSAV